MKVNFKNSSMWKIKEMWYKSIYSAFAKKFGLLH